MAMPCSFDDGNPSVIVVTNLENGDTVSWCANCVLPYYISMVEALQASQPESDTTVASPEASGWDGPPALDVYPAGDPRNDEPVTTEGQAPVSPKATRKRAPRKVVTTSS
jgi:hypothetical protein